MNSMARLSKQRDAAVDRHAEDIHHDADHHQQFDKSDDGIGKELAQQQAGSADRRDEQLFQGAEFAFAHDGERGEEQRDQLQNDPDQARHEEMGALQIGVVQQPRPHVDRHAGCAGGVAGRCEMSRLARAGEPTGWTTGCPVTWRCSVPWWRPASRCHRSAPARRPVPRAAGDRSSRAECASQRVPAPTSSRDGRIHRRRRGRVSSKRRVLTKASTRRRPSVRPSWSNTTRGMCSIWVSMA